MSTRTCSHIDALVKCYLFPWTVFQPQKVVRSPVFNNGLEGSVFSLIMQELLFRPIHPFLTRQTVHRKLAARLRQCEICWHDWQRLTKIAQIHRMVVALPGGASGNVYTTNNTADCFGCLVRDRINRTFVWLIYCRYFERNFSWTGRDVGRYVGLAI